MRLPSFPSAGLFADTVNDADSTRKVYLLAASLTALGIVLIAITVWFWRSTRHDPELLSPLEAMGARRFRNLDGRAQRQLLDSARPPDAEPMRWGVVRAGPEPGSEIDLRAINKSARSDYDDLREQPDAETGDGGDAPDADRGSGADGREMSIVGPIGSGSVAGPSAGGASVEGDPVVGDPVVDDAVVDDAVVDDAVQVGSDTADATAETIVDEFAILDATRTHVALSSDVSDNGVVGSHPVPLLIVPIDHDLDLRSPRAPVASSTKPAADPLGRPAGPDTSPDDDEQPVVGDVTVSIDPLLRKFDRNND